MYRVIIADDEKEVRDTVILLGNWDAAGLEVIFQAQDGDQLYDMAKKCKPDIIITDMKMPGISGSDLVRKLSEDYAEIKIIIISGYDDFQYTKQAITSRVVDYILKPIDEDQLNNTLFKAVKEIEEQKNAETEHASLRIKLNEALPFLKERLFNRFIDGMGMDEDKFLKLAELIVNKEIGAKYTAAILSFENFGYVCDEIFKSDMELLEFALQNIVAELINGKGTAFYTGEKVKKEIVMVFFGKGSKDELFAVIRSIEESLKEIFGIKMFACVGRTYDTFLDVKYSLNDARTVLMQINLIGDKRIAFYEDISEYSKGSIASFAINENPFIVAVENGNMDLIRKSVESLYKDIKEMGLINIYSIKKLNSEIISLLEKMIGNTEAKSEFFNRIIGLREYIDRQISIDVIKEAMMEFLETVSVFFSSKRRKKEISNIYKIKNYIDENFHSKLTLGNLSEKFYWSEEYISKMFKEEFGCNLYKYLTSLRIEKAKIMIMNNDVKKSEIIELLGFTDGSHFNRAFKKYTGMNPKTFKETNRQKQ